MWMSGGCIKTGITYGKTDYYCYNIVKDPFHIHDYNATILHLLGVDHTRLTFKFQGRDFRLTDVEGEVASYLITRRYERWMPEGRQVHPWVADVLGLGAYPIIQRDPVGPVRRVPILRRLPFPIRPLPRAVNAEWSSDVP